MIRKANKAAFGQYLKKLFKNSKNKHELIKLLSYVFTEHGIEVHVATDDADTMVASKALNLS